MRKALQAKGLGQNVNFRMRGHEVTRLEAFTDAVFAFAVTLLVVSLEVPKTFDELMETMKGFPAFAVCFALLALLWYNHYVFFRRYGLQDGMVTVLNFILLFVTLFYVYPLKFLFTVLLNLINGHGNTVIVDGKEVAAVGSGQMASLMVIYGIGFAAVYLVFAALYWHAYRSREKLDLDEAESFLTRSGVSENLVMASIGTLSVTICLINSGLAGIAGMCYWLIPVAMSIHGSVMGARLRRLVGSG